MKQILTIFSFFLFTALSFGQAPEYDDLKVLYADGNYPKLVKAAERYTLKDATKKHILPYIWLSKGLYKISLSGTDDDNFKNAYKDAIKHLGKGMKYDIKYNDGATIAEELEYINLFQASLFEVINNELSSGSFKRGKGWAIKYIKVTQNSIGAKYVLGACAYYDGDKPGARTKWQEADKQLKEIESLDGWSEADRNMLKYGVLYSAAALKKSRQGDKAKALVGKVAQWFESDEDWQELYDSIVNGI